MSSPRICIEGDARHGGTCNGAVRRWDVSSRLCGVWDVVHDTRRCRWGVFSCVLLSHFKRKRRVVRKNARNYQTIPYIFQSRKYRSYRLSNLGDPCISSHFSLQRSFVSISYQPSTLAENLSCRAGNRLQRCEIPMLHAFLRFLMSVPFLPLSKIESTFDFIFKKYSLKQSESRQHAANGSSKSSTTTSVSC